MRWHLHSCGEAPQSIETNRQLSMGAPATFAGGCPELATGQGLLDPQQMWSCAAPHLLSSSLDPDRVRIYRGGDLRDDLGPPSLDAGECSPRNNFIPLRMAYRMILRNNQSLLRIASVLPALMSERTALGITSRPCQDCVGTGPPREIIEVSIAHTDCLP